MTTQKDDKLPAVMQENLLTLLCFDAKRAKMARHALTPNLFEGAVYRDIASQALDFLDQFGEPINEHLPDQLDHILSGSDARKASSYKKAIDNLYGAQDSINGEYILTSLHKFVRQQNMKSAIVKAVECLEDGRIDDAEVAVQLGLNTQIGSFELGTDIRDPTSALKFLDLQDEAFFTGITELDRRNAQPSRKELMLFVAPRGRGKSWFMTHMAKMGLLQRASVLIVTLEMSEARYSQRFLQSFFSVSKRDQSVRVPIFSKDAGGNLTDIAHEEIERITLNDPNIRALLGGKIRREFKRRPPLIIKSFPTGSLTMPMLKAYLDGLERFHKIVPDIIIVDYPDLMEIDSKNLRTETGKVFADLRGLAVERNAAMIVPTQGNRESETSKLVTGAQVAEDISKLAIADIAITYSQTPAEKKLGLARLLVDKNRNDEDKFQLLISQAYMMGQFHLDSALMAPDYWDLVMPPNKSTRKDEDE